MAWLNFKSIDLGKYRFQENDLAIEYDNTGLLKVYRLDDVVYEKQFDSPTKAILNVETIYDKFKA